jgi:tripartite-type tricarboxylate transporter receptor subunit TctC
MTLLRRDLMASMAATLAMAPPASGVPIISTDQRVTMLLGFAEATQAAKAARMFAACMQAHMPETELVQRNLPGDAGHTMLAALGDATPNGATIGWVTTPTLAARMIDHAEPTLGRRIRLLAQVEREPIAFVSSSRDPANSIQDIIQRAGDDADAVPLGAPPAGSPPHLAALRLQVLAQTQLNIVTFPSSEAARRAVLDGNVSVAVLGLSSVLGDLRDGNLSAIGIAARRRFGLLPDTPILDEGGIPLSAFIRRGIAVPAGTPPEIVAPLIEAAHATASDEAFGSQAEANGYYISWADGVEWLAQMQAEQTELAKLWETNPWLSSSGG